MTIFVLLLFIHFTRLQNLNICMWNLDVLDLLSRVYDDLNCDCGYITDYMTGIMCVNLPLLILKLKVSACGSTMTMLQSMVILTCWFKIYYLLSINQFYNKQRKLTFKIRVYNIPIVNQLSA